MFGWKRNISGDLESIFLRIRLTHGADAISLGGYVDVRFLDQHGDIK